MRLHWRVRGLIRVASRAMIWRMGRRNQRRRERPGLVNYLIGVACVAAAYSGIGWLSTRQPLHGALTGVDFGVGSYAVDWWLYWRQQRATAAATAAASEDSIVAADRSAR